jgi:hypothetical protein
MVLWRLLRCCLELGLRLVLSGLLLALEVLHLEAVQEECLSSRLSAVVFRCALPDVRLVLFYGQLQCIRVNFEYAHCPGERLGGPAHCGPASLSSVHMSLVGIRVLSVQEMLAESYLGWSLRQSIFFLFVTAAVAYERVHCCGLGFSAEYRGPDAGCTFDVPSQQERRFCRRAQAALS